MRDQQYYGADEAAMDPYQSYVVAEAGASEKAIFIRNTYLHVAGAIGAFALLTAMLLNFVPAQTMLRLFGGMGAVGFIVILALYMGASYLASYWAHAAHSKPLQYLGLGLFVCVEALIFWPLLYRANMFFPGVITSAAVMTLALFAGITVGTFLSQRDFSFMGKYLNIALWLVLGLVICGWLVGFQLGMWFSVGMIVLMAGCIMYETSMVMHHYHSNQYVGAALGIFSSVATMFWYVIRLMMQLSSD